MESYLKYFKQLNRFRKYLFKKIKVLLIIWKINKKIIFSKKDSKIIILLLKIISIRINIGKKKIH